MEVVGAAVGALVATTSELLCSCVISKTNTTFNLHSNLAAVEKEMNSLKDRFKEVKRETEAAEKEGNEIRAQVVNWLKDVETLQPGVDANQVVTWLQDVETLQPGVDAIQGQMVNNKKPSRCFLNCRKRYRASREVEKTLEEIKRLLLVAEKFNDDVVRPTRVPRAVEHIPGRSIQGQTTASKKLDEIRKALDDGFKRIGIWGLGGVGKTTLVKNLNNELKNASTHPFGIVIWVTVSKNPVIKNVQTRIAERLNLQVKKEESEQGIASRLYQRLEKEKKFLLILDDVWAKIDLDTLGVPGPDVHEGCHIILTSRLMEVCRAMTTDLEIKIEVLNDVEAWQLFCQKAGNVAHLEEIKPLAEAIVKECCRLPLAIITVGAAMRKKTKVELWKHALKELRSSVPSIEGIEAEVYKPLRLSYDSLQGNNIKSCFLYCCLFPEDYLIRIRDLVRYWRAEGLIGEGQNWEDMDEGISLIENLKDSCLLEDYGQHCVKMHDVVRDVAIWILSTSEDGCKSLVRSGIGLSEISVGEFSNSNSNSLDIVSFIGNNITRLPDCMIQCSKASVLLLGENRALDTVPEKFLQGFEALKVLDLSITSIRSLPHSLLQLRDLRVLLLCYCSNLEELPSLGTLTKLRDLDLRGTCITNLPRGFENLSELRVLNLDKTSELKSIQPGIISKLSCLESLSMRDSGFCFGLKGEEDGRATFEELKLSFNRLHYLDISLNGIPWEKSEDLSWINRMSHLQLWFYQAQERNVQITFDEKRCYIRNLNLSLSQEWIGWFWGKSSSLQLDECTGLVEMLEDFIGSGASFAGLKSLLIRKCPTSLGRGGGCAARCDLLPNLEGLHLIRMEHLNSISELVGHLGLRFHSLRSIKVELCHQMKYILSCGDFIHTLPNLEKIVVIICENLEKLINNESGQNISPDPMVPKLRILALATLPKFKTLCRHKETWPCLEQVEVSECKGLRRLPLTNQNAGTIKEIKGESEWWDALEWDDDQTKTSLLPFFHPR